MRVAVTGATGYVGRFIIAELLARGAEVRAWAREGTDCGGFPRAVTWIKGDLRGRRGIAALVEGADAVVHAAFEHVPGRYRGGEGDGDRPAGAPEADTHGVSSGRKRPAPPARRARAPRRRTGRRRRSR